MVGLGVGLPVRLSLSLLGLGEVLLGLDGS